jgi:hypothetical protein
MGRLAVLLVAAALTLAGCGDDSSSSPGSPAGGPAIADRPFRCPDPKADPEDVVDRGADTLPTGARAALLCWHDNRVQWAPPHGRLTSDLDAVVGVVNQQESFTPSPDIGCGGVGAPAWSMVFRYADGTRTITGDNGGCWDLLVGSTERYGSKKVYAAYLGALVRQRAQEHPVAFRAVPPRCPARVRFDAFDPIADASTARTGVVCVLDGNLTTRRLVLARAELATLRHEIATAARRHTDVDATSACPRNPSSALQIRGIDAWREPFRVDIACGAYRYLRPGTGRYSFATLLPRTEQMLNQLTRS